MNDRYYWGDVLAELRRVLIRAENDTQKELSAQKPGVQAGIWIEQMITAPPGRRRKFAFDPIQEKAQPRQPLPRVKPVKGRTISLWSVVQ